MEVVYVKYNKGEKNSQKTFSIMAPSGNRYSFYEDRFAGVYKHYFADVKMFENSPDFDVVDSLEKTIIEVKEKVEEYIKPKKEVKEGKKKVSKK